MKTLLLTHPLPTQAFAEAVHAIEPQLPLLEYRPGMDDAALAEVQAVLGWRFTAGVVQRLPRLRWVCAVGAGVDKLLVPDLAPGVVVSRMVDPGQALGIAQYVAAMVLRHVRGQPRYDAQQRAHDWTRHPMGAVHPRVRVLGWGAIGREIGRVLQAVGCQVQPWQRSSGPLHAALADADIVVNALPLTPETDGLLDAAAFAAMPRGSYLVNIARGQHVVEADLIAAVQSGQLAGATLDVQATEPLPAGDPLWDVPGITITPHIAGQSSPDVVAAQFIAGLQALRAGQPLPNVVDRSRGY